MDNDVNDDGGGDDGGGDDGGGGDGDGGPPLVGRNKDDFAVLRSNNWRCMTDSDQQGGGGGATAHYEPQPKHSKSRPTLRAAIRS